jgi:hypothetical protein
VGNCVGYLASVLLRSLEHGPLEERMARLEAALCIALNPQQSSSKNEIYDTKLTQSN